MINTMVIFMFNLTRVMDEAGTLRFINLYASN